MLPKSFRQNGNSSPQKKPRDAQQFSKNFVFFADVVFEKSFLQRLVKSKNPDFDSMDQKEQKQAKVNLLRDLIHRDQKELETIQNNADNFRAPEGSFDVILQRKIGGYKRKVDVKNYILKEL